MFNIPIRYRFFVNKILIPYQYNTCTKLKTILFHTILEFLSTALADIMMLVSNISSHL